MTIWACCEARRDNSGTVTVNPDAAKSYAVPAGISANGYSSDVVVG